MVENICGKGTKYLLTAFSPYPTFFFSKCFFFRGVKIRHCMVKGKLVWVSMVTCLKPVTKRQILDSSKLKEFADDNFKIDENAESFQKV